VKGNKTVEFEVKHTHRGPLIDSSFIRSLKQYSYIPVKDEQGPFSIAWMGQYPGESMIKMTLGMASLKNLHEMKALHRSLNFWNGCSLNAVYADHEGNIGFAMMVQSPVRKNDYPLVGSKVHDGSTSAFDWVGQSPIEHLPFSLNPSKGYYVASNNRVVPENSKYDIGAMQNNYLKALRTVQMIESGIKAGKKFTTDDMIVLQDDLLDPVCKDHLPMLMAIVDHGYDRKTDFNLSSADINDLIQMKSLISSWDCRMTTDSIGATIYSYW
jgi:penicillin amidase